MFDIIGFFSVTSNDQVRGHVTKKKLESKGLSYESSQVRKEVLSCGGE